MTGPGRGLRAAAGAVGAGLLMLLGAAPASAVDGAIAHVQSGEQGLEILVSVPPDAEVDLAGVQVSIDGTEVAASAAEAGSDTRVRRTTVLAIDTSRSMRGARFDAAKDAALAFLDSVPADVEVGIVTFDAEVDTALEPTTDRDRARSTIEGLELARDTLLYDGILQAVDLLGSEGQRTLLVLSDGADTSNTRVGAVTSAIEAGEVLVDVVALDQDAEQEAVLQRLADAGQGQVISADSDALGAAFSDEAEVLASQLLVSAELPEGFTASQAEIEVTLPSSAGEVTASAFSTVQEAAGEETIAFALPRPPDEGFTVAGWVKWAGIGVFGLGLLAGLLLMLPRPAPALTAEQRVSAYVRSGGRSPASEGDAGAAPTSDELLSGAKEAAAGVLQRNQGLDARITQSLEAAGSEFKAAEWLLLHGGITIGSGLLGALVGGGNLVFGLVFMVFGAVGPWVYLRFRKSRRRKAFNAALPDTLQLISGSLAAGLSLAQSIDTVVREGAEPIAGEFKRVLVETRLGVPLEDSMEGVAERFESKDFAWVVMAIKIQRQVGGNLAELLDTVAETMREREYLRRQVNALAAEGKLSAIVLSVLPPGFLVYLLLANREYVMPLFTDVRGLVMLIGATLWLLVGVFWMSKLVKVEV